MVGELDPSSETPGTKRMVYLVTFPHPKPGSTLVAPGSMTRMDIAQKFLEACAQPASTVQNRQPQAVVLDRAAVFHELHKANADGLAHSHYHIAVKGVSSFRFAPVKKALQDKFKLASHWSCTHNGYWSPIRYCTVPSPSKTKSSLDPQPVLWSRLGLHPPLHLMCHEPQTAPAMWAKRQRKEDRAAETAKQEPRMTEYELWPLVVESGIQNTVDDRQAHLRLMKYVKEHCSAATCAFVFKNRARLPALIDDIWRWESIGAVVAAAERTLSDMMTAAMLAPCTCGGSWTRFAAFALDTNRIDVTSLCKSVLRALKEGRSPTCPIVTLAGISGGEGKSFFLKGLAAVVGQEHVFWTPTHPSFPLHGVEDAKVVILDEFRFTKSVVPLATQCLWFDGSAVPVAKPQTAQAATSHMTYRGRAPIFITTSKKEADLLAQAEDGDAAMVMRRLQVFSFTTRVAKPGCSIPNCAYCFATFVMKHGL